MLIFDVDFKGYPRSTVMTLKVVPHLKMFIKPLMLCGKCHALLNFCTILLLSELNSSTSTRLYDVPGTHNVGLPTQYRFNGGLTSPIASSMPVNRIRRWPNIETELVDCPVFALTAIRVTLLPRKATTRITRYIAQL